MNNKLQTEAKLDLALAQLQASPENGKSVRFNNHEGMYTIRTMQVKPFTIEVTAPTGERRLYILEAN